MPESGRRKARETEAAKTKKPSQEPQAKTGKPAGPDQSRPASGRRRGRLPGQAIGCD